MTKPRASRENSRGQRVYPIPNPADGEIIELPSVSRLDSALYSFPLEAWKLTTVASEMAKRKDLVILAATDPKWAYKQALNSAQRSANVGSSVHALSEQAEEGTLDLDLLSDDARAWVQSYMMAKEMYNWRVILQEETTYNFTLHYAGTLDRVMEIPGEGVVIVDLKTGRGVYGSSASQLALYANGEGIFRPPVSCPEAAKLRRKLENDIQNGTNLPEGRRKWSKAAQDGAFAEIDARYWEEYARLGEHLPMPAGLRTDKAFLLHLFGPDERGRPQPGELVPLRLDKELPAALSFLYQWSNDRTIIGEPWQIGTSVTKEETKATPISSEDRRLMVAQEHKDELLARARALPKELQESLKANWPEYLPPLSRAEPDHWDEIDELIGAQEALVLLGAHFPGATVDR